MLFRVPCRLMFGEAVYFQMDRMPLLQMSIGLSADFSAMPQRLKVVLPPIIFAKDQDGFSVSMVHGFSKQPL